MPASHILRDLAHERDEALRLTILRERPLAARDPIADDVRPRATLPLHTRGVRAKAVDVE
jgi:hypothetical protein